MGVAVAVVVVPRGVRRLLPPCVARRHVPTRNLSLLGQTRSRKFVIFRLKLQILEMRAGS